MNKEIEDNKIIHNNFIIDELWYLKQITNKWWPSDVYFCIKFLKNQKFVKLQKYLFKMIYENIFII